jgi:dsRNA-specific ribonuclease
MKDAAFQAYMALYRAGLINNHMLPLLRHGSDVDELLTTKVETRASLMVVSEQLNPWIHIAQAQNEKSHLAHYRMTVGTLAIEVYLPVDLPPVPPFQLYWDTVTGLTVEIVPDPVFSVENCGKARGETLLLLEAAFGSRFPIEQKSHVILFSTLGDHPLGHRIGNYREAENYAFEQNPSSIGLIRDKSQINVRYIYQASLPNKPTLQSVKLPYDGYEITPDSPHLSLKRLSRKADFLHKVPSDNRKLSSKPFNRVLPTSRCIVDEIPFGYVQFSLLIPSIMHRFEVYLVAEILSKSILEKVEISSLGLVVTALTASSANEGTNYQRLEFLGDSILKLCTSIQLIAEFPLWHEGYLSAKKDRLVANSRLSRAAMDVGLDKFIISKKFTGLKWRPLYMEDLLEASTDGKRELSSKVLADVVEALIGASMVDGGLPKALTCLQVFLPELQWKSFEVRRAELFYRVPDIQLPETLKPLETLIGYNFTKKALLLEAFTHASCNSGSQSLERLEFLGDSLLDRIVVKAMYDVEPELSHFQMHILRTALVNADFLAFICMDWHIEQEICNLRSSSSDGSDSDSTGFDEITTRVKVPLWRFMRHMSPAMGSVQAATLKRFAELQSEIKTAIDSGSQYPWALLAKLQAQKFYSDIIESLLGAVWIDSGDMDTCTAIVARMGILDYLQRIVEERVRVMHPKEELGILADDLAVKYTLSLGGWQDDGVRQYVCEVFVGDERIVEYVDGVSKMEAQTKAAEIAVSILRDKKHAGLGVGGGDEMELDIDNVVDGDAMQE